MGHTEEPRMYQGIGYRVLMFNTTSGEQWNISVSQSVLKGLKKQGCNIKLLQNIGDQNPVDVWDKVLASGKKSVGQSA